MKEEVNEIKHEVDEFKNHEKSLVFELLSDMKATNKRIFSVLITVILLWFLTIGGFVIYISNVGYEETIEYVETNDDGNACIGDSCNNGVINGESN